VGDEEVAHAVQARRLSPLGKRAELRVMGPPKNLVVMDARDLEVDVGVPARH
jgi:hypothetical protein